MTIEVNGATPVFTSNQTCVMYEGVNAPRYPLLNGVLAPSTDDSLYYSGRLLSIYTEANAPSPALVGTFVNYDPASTNPDQAIPTHVIAGEFVPGLPGLDTTSQTTATNTLNIVSVAPLLTGTTMYLNSLTDNNPAPVMTGFEAYFVIATITTTQLQNEDCDVISIQGVA